MAQKKNNSSGSRKNSHQNAKKTPVLPKRSIKEISIKYWKIFSGILLIVCAIPAIVFIKNEFFTSAIEQHDKQYLTQGDLKSPKIFNDSDSSIVDKYSDTISLPAIKNNYPKVIGLDVKGFNNHQQIIVNLSNRPLRCTPKDFYKGVYPFDSLFSSCLHKKLILGVKNERLYVSVEFKDLEKEETIGIIEFNHWQLYNPNFIKVKVDPDEKKLEVYDLKSNIVFTINYKELDSNVAMITIGGYFLDDNSALIIPTVADGVHIAPDTMLRALCISKRDKRWKAKARKAAHSVHSIY